MKSFLPLTKAILTDTSYVREWQTVQIANRSAEFLQRMQRVIIGGKRLELTKPGMAFGTLAENSGSIVLVNQERPTGDGLCNVGWEVKGGYGANNRTGSDTANKEAEEETKRKVTTSSPLAILRADHAHEFHPISINTVSLGDEDSVKVQKYDSSERHALEWIRESRAFTYEQVRELYMSGQLSDARTLGVLFAQTLRDGSKNWCANYHSIYTGHTIRDLQHRTHRALLAIAKIKSETEIGYDDVLMSDPGRIEYLCTSTINNKAVFYLQPYSSHTLSPNHTVSAIDQLELQEALRVIENVPLDEIQSYELVTDEPFKPENTISLRHTLVSNPANEQYGVQIGVAKFNPEILRDQWIDRERLAKLVQNGEVSLLTLAAIQAYLWESGSNF
jgi:ADP-ribose pyrophosphatase YjhB (NUDIX family)